MTSAKPEHFFKAFEHCLKCRMTKKQALVMARGFSKRGMVDASEGATHYALRHEYWDNQPKYFIVNYGNDAKKFKTLKKAKEFALNYWNEKVGFKAFNIIWVSNLSRRVVYQRTSKESL